MNVPHQSSKDILRRVRETLETAQHGLLDMKRDPARRQSGLRNLVVFGRAVTNVLQNLRSTEKSFDEWYQRYVEEMKADPLMKFFYELRTRILKRGDLAVGNYAHINKFELPRDFAKFGPPPKNAKGFFIGDQSGGAGWEVEVQQGVVEKYYVGLPGDVGVAGLYFHDAPGLNDASSPSDKDVVTLSEKYVRYLEGLVTAAEKAFAK